MNVLNVFQDRVNAIFQEAGVPATKFPFRKLAKKVSREMEGETFVIDGIDTAPALYTVLVSPQDDDAMHTLYAPITEEVSSLVEAQAKKRGYSFVGKPLVRFMIDPALKATKFAVFAENVDPATLSRLRDEELVYLGVAPAKSAVATASEVISQEPKAPVDPMDAGLDIIPDDIESAYASESPSEPPYVATEAPLEAVPLASIDQANEEVEVVEPEPSVASAPEPDPVAVEMPVATEEQPVAAKDVLPPVDPAPEVMLAAAEVTVPTSVVEAAPEPEAPSVTCTFTNRENGRVYTLTGETMIGRERTTGNIVLRDPNVSRRHAKVTYDGSHWIITDLHSTNGTLVNDIDVEECLLQSGDIVTIGLVNLEFREG